MSLTEYAQNAYKLRKETGMTTNPHIWSSEAYYAHELAIWLERHNRPMPKKVTWSRGYSVRADGAVYKIVEDAQSLTFLPI